jgi:hypothetical protein
MRILAGSDNMKASEREGVGRLSQLGSDCVKGESVGWI